MGSIQNMELMLIASGWRFTRSKCNYYGGVHAYNALVYKLKKTKCTKNVAKLDLYKTG